MSSPNNAQIPPQTPPSTGKVLEIDPAKVSIFRQRLREEQNFPLAVLSGGAAAGAGAILWAFLAVASGHNAVIMAIVVGASVGFAVRQFGKGVENRFGILGAVFSFVGCALGHFLAVAAIISRQESAPLPFVLLYLLTQPLLALQFMTTNFGALDLIFYGFALYEGYKLSFRKVTDEEKESLYRVRPRSP